MKQTKITFYCKIIVAIFVLQLTISNLNAQVTIGAIEAPRAGALLDLRENDKLGANSTKGLMLPRIKITDLKSLDDLVKNLDPTEHIGLTVYNPDQEELESQCDAKDLLDALIHRGIYVWSGTEWNMLGEKPKLVGPNGIPESWMGEGVSTLTDIEGNIYFTMDYGPTAGVWMTQNMRSKTFDTKAVLNFPATVGGLPHLKEGKLSRDLPYYAYPTSEGVYDVGNPTTRRFFDADPTIGLLYNMGGAWAEGYGNSNPAAAVGGLQGICPNGWYIPNRADWRALLNELSGPNYAKYVKKGIQNSGNFYLVLQPCAVASGISQTFIGYSRPSWEGGFAANYMGYIIADSMLAPMANDGSTFWAGTFSEVVGSRPGVVGMVPTTTVNSLPLIRYWSDSGDRSMGGVRCKKK